MTEEDAKIHIRNNPNNYLEKARKKGRVCPVCNSGRGKNGTGLEVTDDKIHFTCFSLNCFSNSDVIDIIGVVYGLEGYNDKLLKACDIYNITIDDHHQPSEAVKTAVPKTIIKATENEQNEPDQIDYTEFFKVAHENLIDSNYLTNRGISKAVQDRFKIGYVEGWQSPKALKGGKYAPKSDRIILPTSTYSYVARDIRPDDKLTEPEKKFKHIKEGRANFFNMEALENTKPVFIVEGVTDALSIIEAGSEAVALGSTSGVNKFVEWLEANKPKAPLLLALDNDENEAGATATTKLTGHLKRLNIKYYKADLYDNYNDANEILVNDIEKLKSNIEKCKSDVAEVENAEKNEYLKTSAHHHIKAFTDEIKDSVNTTAISTGFNNLDNILDGGLYEGLYIMGAISSLGKTTLALQIADNIAESGQDILIFSLEMSRNELIAKSISKGTAIECTNKKISFEKAKTTRGITVYKWYDNYSDDEKTLINKSILDYSKYAKHIFIHEGIGNIGAEKVREVVKKHINTTGNTPVIIVDYLQILAPYNERATDKQNTDKNILELKRLSRDYKLSVLGISSFNRANYKISVSMEAFKESGAIEYSSDVLIGLQLKGAGAEGFDVDEAKGKKIREIELKILKNRNGATGKPLQFDYYPMFNYFEEANTVPTEL